jgi:hypothetical protein
MTEERSGTGTLFFPDGRTFGFVRYTITTQLPLQPGGMRRTRGSLISMDPARSHSIFGDIANGDGYGALQLDNGEWWICNVQPDGEASPRHPAPDGPFHPAGPQPKV